MPVPTLTWEAEEVLTMTVTLAPRGSRALLAALVLVCGLVPLASPAPVAAVAPSSAPTGLTPTVGDTVNANPVLSWTGVSGAAKYRVQVSTSATFAVITWTVDTQGLDATPVTDLPLGTLYWRVAAMDASSNLGPWGDTQFTKAWGVAPAPQYPADLATLYFPTDALRFTWSALDGASSYELQVDDATDFISATTYTTKSTSYVITEPKTSGQTFYWRVRGDSATSGVVSNWSDTRQFSVLWQPDGSTPGSPTLIYPDPSQAVTVDAGAPASSCPGAQVLGQALGCDLYFEWSPVLGAKTYELQVSPNADWSNNKTIDVVVKGTRYAPPSTLNNGNYYWRVRAQDAASPQNNGPWGGPSAFAFARSWSTRPTLLEPANGNTTVSVPTFSWTPVDHASWYQLDMSTDINFGTAVQTCYTNRTTYTPYSGATGINITPPGSCNFFPHVGIVYYWHVRGIDAPVLNPGIEYPQGVLGLWSNTSNSDVFSFVYQPSVPAYVSPDDGATVQVPTLTWADAPGAVKYHVTIVKDATNSVVASADTYSTSWTPTSLLNVSDSPFRWYVQAYDQNNQLSVIPNQADQRTFNLTAITTTFTTPDQTSPADGTGSFAMPALAWQPVTGATSYQVVWGVQGVNVDHFDWPRASYPAFTYPTSVFSVGTYYWYVQAYNGATLLSTSAADITFTISQLDLLAPTDYLTPCPVVDSRPTCKVQDTATLTWNPVPGAFSYTVYVAVDPNFTNTYRTYTTTYTQLSPRDSWLDNQANQAYYWFVRPARSGNTGRFDSVAQANASYYQKQSNPIQLVAPANGSSVADEVTFSWTDFLATNQVGPAAVTQEAKQYHIQVSTVADFATTFDDKTVDQTFFTEYDKTYPEGPLYWRVQAIDGSGNPLTWSNAQMLVTKASPTVVPIYPTAGATVAGVPYLQWTPQAFAATYDVQIAKNGDVNFSSPNQVTLTNTKMSAFAYTDALAAGDYAWRVRRDDADGRAGPWSTGLVFHLVPSAPSLLAPSNGAQVNTGALPTFLLQWSSTQSYPKYVLQVSPALTFTTLTENRTTVMSSWAPLTFYASGTYYWRVQALNANGTVVATSNVWSFTVTVPASSLGVSAGLTQVSGIAFTTTVTARGSNGATLATYRGTVHFTSSDPSAVLPSDYTFTGADAGVHTFSVTLETAGTQSVTATDTAIATVNGTQGGILVVVPASYHPLNPPIRLLDTRHNNGLSGRLLANTPATFGVTQQARGDSSVPAGASAVTGNLTVTGSTFSWAVYLGPNPVASPTSSTVNFSAGETTANGLTVALSGTGTLSATYISNPGNTTDLVFDVTGYFTPDATGATYHPMTPVRLLDSRANNGLGAKIPANTPVSFHVSAANRVGSQVPANATAVTGNLTVVNETFAWAVYVGPVANASPTTSTLNFLTGDIKANSLTVTLDDGSLDGAGHKGDLWLTYMSTPGNTTDLVFDVTGYYTADTTGSMFVPVTPTRLLDTRTTNTPAGVPGKLLANTPFYLPVSVAGHPGSPVPSNASAVTGNVTVTNPSFAWALYCGDVSNAAPTTSTLNFTTGQTKANGVTVSLGSGGMLWFTYLSTSGNTTDLVFDVTGYFVPAS
jgi:hypothetical protein